MNIVFWVLVLVALFGVWMLLSYGFKAIGRDILNAKKTIKDNLVDEENEIKEEEKETKE